jgi:hypothetical protein
MSILTLEVLSVIHHSCFIEERKFCRQYKRLVLNFCSSFSLKPHPYVRLLLHSMFMMIVFHFLSSFSLLPFQQVSRRSLSVFLTVEQPLIHPVLRRVHAQRIGSICFQTTKQLLREHVTSKCSYWWRQDAEHLMDRVFVKYVVVYRRFGFYRWIGFDYIASRRSNWH